MYPGAHVNTSIAHNQRLPGGMPHRRKLLLALLQVFGGQLPSRDFQKLLMLHEAEFASAPCYDFVPYKYGGFSFQSYADRRALVAGGLLVDADDWQLVDGIDALRELEPAVQDSVRSLKRAYGKLKGQSLVREVYRRYPYYAIRSEIASKLLTNAELSAVDKARPIDTSECLFTIGYEGISLDTYLNKLMRNNVRVLCDVRRNPLSRKYGFSKSTLKEAVERLGMNYVHIPELGISSDKRQSLVTQQDYDRLFAQYECTTLKDADGSIDQVRGLLTEHGRVALTCFEADVCMCHRGRVVKALVSSKLPPASVKHL